MLAILYLYNSALPETKSSSPDIKWILSGTKETLLSFSEHGESSLTLLHSPVAVLVTVTESVCVSGGGGGGGGGGEGE